MINAVYQLIAPRMIDVTYQEMHLSGSQVLIRPLYLSICHADQRYYQGMRSEAALKAKLPMALIHECVAEVIYDPTGAFQVGDRVIPIPNSPHRRMISLQRIICALVFSAPADTMVFCRIM